MLVQDCIPTRIDNQREREREREKEKKKCPCSVGVKKRKRMARKVNTRGSSLPKSKDTIRKYFQVCFALEFPSDKQTGQEVPPWQIKQYDDQ